MRAGGRRAGFRRAAPASVAAAGAVLTMAALAGCVSEPTGIFDREQTAADRPAPGSIAAWPVVVDPASVRFAGQSGGASIWVARAQAQPGGVCMLIDVPESPGDGAAGCGGIDRIGVETQRLEARLQLGGIADEDIPDGWTRLTREVIVSD